VKRSDANFLSRDTAPRSSRAGPHPPWSAPARNASHPEGALKRHTGTSTDSTRLASASLSSGSHRSGGGGGLIPPAAHSALAWREHSTSRLPSPDRGEAGKAPLEGDMNGPDGALARAHQALDNADSATRKWLEEAGFDDAESFGAHNKGCVPVGPNQTGMTPAIDSFPCIRCCM
jgi:hypothetical protein